MKNVSEQSNRFRDAFVAAMDDAVVVGLTSGQENGWDAIEAAFEATDPYLAKKVGAVWLKRTRLYYRLLATSGRNSTPEVVIRAYMEIVESDRFPVEEVIKLGRVAFGTCMSFQLANLDEIRNKILEVAGSKLSDTAIEILADLLQPVPTVPKR